MTQMIDTFVTSEIYSDFDGSCGDGDDGDDDDSGGSRTTQINDSMSIYRLQNSIGITENHCKGSLFAINNVLKVLHEINTDFQDVTGRTNSLMLNCEILLEQQYTFQQTVEALRRTLVPFDDIEVVADLLGIPFDVNRNGYKHTDFNKSAQNTLAGSLDPRSPEFKDILNRLAQAAIYLKTHLDIFDSNRYNHWLEKLENRASSLVGRAMRVVLENASKQCHEFYDQNRYSTKTNLSSNDVPIESLPLYQKFRGLSFRLRELCALLLKGAFAEALALNLNDGALLCAKRKSNDSKFKNSPFATERDIAVIAEVKKDYVLLRNELLRPFIKETWLNSVRAASAVDNMGSINNGSLDLLKVLEEMNEINFAHVSIKSANPIFPVSLCLGIRLAFSMMLRITQLELQLFESLFALHPLMKETSPNKGADCEDAHFLRSNGDFSFLEVNIIVEQVINGIKDFLRPLIIRESSIDELCRVIAALSEDVRSQILVMSVPSSLLHLLIDGLNGIVNDAKERLSYCAEMCIRQEVQLFEPLPSQLAYPDILDDCLTNKETGGVCNSAQNSSISVSEVYNTWYPPMRSTLSLLSKLFGVVQQAVFEDFARRAIDLCVTVLKKGSDAIKRSRPGIHGDLFLVRHCLMLREQLAPFELCMKATEKFLDFSTTGDALQNLIGNTRSILRFDRNNGFLRLARSGLPRMYEMQIDAKKELDDALKVACFSFQRCAVKLLLGNMDTFLAKVTAFVGEIPLLNSDDNGADNSTMSAGLDKHQRTTPLLTVASNLKNQAFVRPDRIKDLLESVQVVLLQRVPDLKLMMKLYIDNGVARNILLKPILHDFEVATLKMECIISSCIDDGKIRRDLEHILETISSMVQNDLLR
eukprot:CAMPEP_0170381734 /NCGR_PEP_ID=MMETSP0117_2-20130122/14567_1 /TAXON_ID=400756 /ORGANISM="Durinskia baltica, Strain CSIRO CS-38" /LENGTH=872 /DNA_ID=CAMNT_0010637325 /DNA_START=183 /DNA_END=2801 /DNA_ORIENTATION=+